MMAAESKPSVITRATVAGVREELVLAFIVADPLTAAIGFRKIVGCATEPTAARSAFVYFTRGPSLATQDSPGWLLRFLWHVDFLFPTRSGSSKNMNLYCTRYSASAGVSRLAPLIFS
jgi:hypothetical protein